MRAGKGGEIKVRSASGSAAIAGDEASGVDPAEGESCQSAYPCLLSEWSAPRKWGTRGKGERIAIIPKDVINFRLFMGSIQVNDSNRPPLKCLIVGAGSSGIAAAKEALKAGLEPHVYEARDGPGGAWRYDKDPGPCKVDFNQDGWATFSNPGESDFRGPSPPSPMYDGLKTNVPTSLMQYRGTPFRPEIVCPRFRRHVAPPFLSRR